MSKHDLLMIGASEKDADLYYATGFAAPDAFIFARIRGIKYLLMSDLEIDRAKRQSRGCRVLSTTQLAAQYKKKHKKAASFTELVLFFLRQKKIRNVLVPGNFPVRHYEPLRRAGLRIRYQNGLLFPERLVKTNAEIAAIRQALRATEKAAALAVTVLKKSVIRGRRLYYAGKILTSEVLRALIHRSLSDAGYHGEHTIISCGRHSSDPHERGSGPLYAHQPIVMDIFPRSEKTFYYADFTRTVVRGKASPELKRMYAAVKEGQTLAIKMIRSGIPSQKVHQAIHDRFSQLGFTTGMKDGHMQGFFHSTGHGLGLELHEAPRVGPGEDVLKAGHVVTVEPGLYYKGVGGVRLEDVIVVTKKGCTNLTKFPRILEI